MDKPKNIKTFKKLMGFTHNEYIHYRKEKNYIENHWKLYSYISASTINGMNLIESKIDQFILNYYQVNKNLELDFTDKILSNINFRNKYDTFIKIFKESFDYSPEFIAKIEKIESLRKYRNKITHGFLEDNFDEINETDKRDRIKLKYYNSSTKKNDTEYITLMEHEDKLKQIEEAYYELKILLIQVFNRIEYLADNNSPIKKKLPK